VSIDNQIAQLKAQRSLAEKDRVKLEIQKAEAEKNFKQAQDLLKEEYGVTSVEEAKSLLAKMEADLREQISLAEISLRGIKEGQ
jgi:hypothetical protein